MGAICPNCGNVLDVKDSKTPFYQCCCCHQRFHIKVSELIPDAIAVTYPIGNAWIPGILK